MPASGNAGAARDTAVSVDFYLQAIALIAMIDNAGAFDWASADTTIAADAGSFIVGNEFAQFSFLPRIPFETAATTLPLLYPLCKKYT
jgi:hypothetical protein